MSTLDEEADMSDQLAAAIVLFVPAKVGAARLTFLTRFRFTLAPNPTSRAGVVALPSSPLRRSMIIAGHRVVIRACGRTMDPAVVIPGL